MAADLSAIRAAIHARLETLLGNTGNAYSYWQPSPNSPCMQILGFAQDFDDTFGRGTDTLRCVVQGISRRGLDEAALRQIDDWCDGTGSSSLKAAIETERPAAVTLGGLVSSCRVTDHSLPVVTRMDDGQDAWVVDFTLEIIT